MFSPLCHLKPLVLLVPILAGVACAGPVRAKNVIVMVADGAGVGHWTLAKFARENLAVGAFPVAGLVDTRGSGHVVTGSAAGATALSTGTRTFFGAVGVGPDSLPRETVLEAAHRRGMATGLVTTTYVADATPAAFGAHVSARSEMIRIVQQMTTLPVDVVMGGGRDLLDLAEERAGVDLRGPILEHYTYIESASELESIDPDTVNALLGLFSGRDMPRAAERSPSLTAMMSKALDILDADADGFFLMVENEGTDTEAHGNVEQDILVAEILAFDDAVQLALDFLSRHPETLIVVVADHETGGITLTHDEDRNPILEYSTPSHTGAFVPLFAIGPGAERFGGLKQNQEIGRLLLEAVRR